MEPALKKGWLRKQSRSGIVKNWQSRFFVMTKGKIAYYSKELDRFPYGDDLKGELHLADAKVSKKDSKQIYIIASGQKDLLMEAAGIDEADEWLAAIQTHIAAADSLGLSRMSSTGTGTPSTSVGPGTLSREPSTMGSIKGPSFTGSEDAQDMRTSDPDGGVPLGTPSRGDIVVVPKPGWVIKVMRTNNEKIFINLCEHSEVPNAPNVLGFSKWPFMVLTPARQVADDKGEVTVYDAVVNPAVIVQCGKDPNAKDATCARVMRLLKKQYGEDLQAEFKLPKITKRYKGEVLAVNLPSTVGAMARSRSSVIVPSAAAAGSAPGRGLERSNSLKPTRNGSVFVGAPPAAAAAAGIAATPASPVPASPVPAAAPVPNTPTPLALAMGDSSAQDDERPSSVSLSDPSRQSQSAVKAVRSPYQTQSLAPIGQSATGMERRTTISRLFLNVDQQPGAAGNLTRVHTEVPFAVASEARAGGSTSRAIRSSMANSAIAPRMAAPGASTATGPAEDLPKFVIPYQIVRSNGTIAKTSPDKTAAGRILGHGVKVFVIARRVIQTSIKDPPVVWLGTTEGWILERTGPATGAIASAGPGRVLIPSLHGQPISMKVVSTRFEDISVICPHPRLSQQVSTRDSGWNFFQPSTARPSMSSVPFQTRFVLDVFHMDSAVVRISRNFSEVCELRDVLVASPLKVVKDRALKAGSLPFDEDGLEDFIEDVNALLALVEGVESWMNKILEVSLSKCKALADFLQPREQGDYEHMENELMARGGLGGAWEDELTQGF